MRHRFDREIHAASTLNHPNIVRILAIDEVDSQQLLAMEWVDGVPITEWATASSSGRRSLNDLLNVFLEVCGAVHHAHQRGVIHRDLKPPNILVDSHDRPHVVDFGLAKIRDAEALSDQTLTETGQFVGTPAYAAPEQLEGGSAFDVRTDVYSLGVVLFHILTGQLPYSVEGSLFEIARTIRETEPVRPSTLSKRGDRMLDAIVLKALAKEKTSRFQSVEALADDLQRYLRGDVIRAPPISRRERLSRAFRRNPIAASFMIAVSLGMTVGLVHLSRLSGNLLEQTALDSAAMQADMLDRMNALYSSTVAAPMRRIGVDVTHDFCEKEGAIPLPATFTIVLGEEMRDSEYGMKLRLYSDYPFRTRTDGGPRDAFEREALDLLRQNPDRAVHRFEDYDGQYSLRYATARRMRESCVQCHNHHPDSTKTDWKVGDVRGVQEIIHPLERDVVRTRDALRGTFLLVGVISGAFFLLSIAAVVVGNRRRVQRFSGAGKK